MEHPSVCPGDPIPRVAGTAPDTAASRKAASRRTWRKAVPKLTAYVWQKPGSPAVKVCAKCGCNLHQRPDETVEEFEARGLCIGCGCRSCGAMLPLIRQDIGLCKGCGGGML